MKKENLIFIIVIILIIGILCILFINKKSNNTNISNETIGKLNTINNENVIPQNKVGIVKHYYTGYGTIAVIVRNNTNKTLDFLKVIAICYDAEGNNLGEKTAGKSNIQPNENYKIEIACGTSMKKYNVKIEY